MSRLKGPPGHRVGAHNPGSAGILPARFDSFIKERRALFASLFFDLGTHAAGVLLVRRQGAHQRRAYLMKIMRPGTFDFHLQRLDASRLHRDNIVLMLQNPLNQ